MVDRVRSVNKSTLLLELILPEVELHTLRPFIHHEVELEMVQLLVELLTS